MSLLPVMDLVLHPELSLYMHQVTVSVWWRLSASLPRTSTGKSVCTGGAGTQCKHRSYPGDEVTSTRWEQDSAAGKSK